MYTYMYIHKIEKYLVTDLLKTWSYIIIFKVSSFAQQYLVRNPPSQTSLNSFFFLWLYTITWCIYTYSVIPLFITIYVISFLGYNKEVTKIFLFLCISINQLIDIIVMNWISRSTIVVSEDIWFFVDFSRLLSGKSITLHISTRNI